jgi:CheY-like chemotaxis protein
MPRRILVVDDSATLRKIVATLLREAGFEVETARDGAEGLDRVQRERFDLLVTDFVMPRLNGYQFVQALRSIEGLRELPVVLMSARAEQVAERFIAQTGARAALAKPFTPAALLDAVHGALRTHVQSAVLPPPTEEEDPIDALFDGIFDTSFLPPPPTTESLAAATSTQAPSPPRVSAITLAGTVTGESAVHRRPSPPEQSGPNPVVLLPADCVSGAVGLERERAEAQERFVRALAAAALPALRTSSAGDVSEESLARALAEHFGESRLRELAREVRAFDPVLRARVVLEGTLGAVPLGEVFQLLCLQSQSGLFVLERSHARVTFALRGGRIDLGFADGLGREFRIGRYLIAAGLVTRARVERALHEASENRALAGATLVAAGLIKTEEVQRALARQTAELLYEVLTWTSGTFRFEAGATSPEANLARLSLPSEPLLLEGVRRIDEWRLIRQHVASDGVVLARGEALPPPSVQASLDPTDRRVLDAIDGRRSVRDLIDALDLGPFEVSKALYRLVHAQLIAPVAA